MAFNPLRAALPFCDHLIFAHKQVGGLFKGLLSDEFAPPLLAAQRQIPVLSDLRGTAKVFFLRSRTALLTFEIGIALPVWTAVSSIHRDFATQNLMSICHGSHTSWSVPNCGSYVPVYFSPTERANPISKSLIIKISLLRGPDLNCNRRSNNPSQKRLICSVAPD